MLKVLRSPSSSLPLSLSLSLLPSLSLERGPPAPSFFRFFHQLAILYILCDFFFLVSFFIDFLISLPLYVFPPPTFLPSFLHAVALFSLGVFTLLRASHPSFYHFPFLPFFSSFFSLYVSLSVPFYFPIHLPPLPSISFHPSIYLGICLSLRVLAPQWEVNEIWMTLTVEFCQTSSLGGPSGLTHGLHDQKESCLPLRGLKPEKRAGSRAENG